MKWMAYDKVELFNLEMEGELHKLHKQNKITVEQYVEMKEKYSSKIYIPVIYIRVLLYLATLVAISASVGIFSPIFFSMNGESIVYAILFIVFSIGLFLMLEYAVIKHRNHFRSGIDDAFLHLSFLSFFVGVTILFDDIFKITGKELELVILFILIIFSAIAAIRYTDRLFTLIAFLGAMYWVFKLLMNMKGDAMFLIPIVIFVVSSIIAWLAESKRKIVEIHYEVNVQLVLYSALIVSCISVNYQVVKELANEFIFYGSMKELPFGNVFLVLTAVVPAAMLFVGVKYRKIAFIRVGFVALALAIPTYTHYFNVNNLMRGLLVGGASSFIFALLLYRKLKKDGNVYTVIATEGTDTDNLVRTIITVSTAATSEKKQISSDEKHNTEFGGGDFGGGGAGGSF